MNTAITNLLSLNENADRNYFTVSDTPENRQTVLAVVNSLVDAQKWDDWRDSRVVTGYLDNYCFQITWFPKFQAKSSRYNKNPKVEPAHFNVKFWEYNPELTIEEIKIVEQVKSMDWTYEYAEGQSWYAGCRQQGKIETLLANNASLPTERKELIFREADVERLEKNLTAWAYRAFGLSS